MLSILHFKGHFDSSLNYSITLRIQQPSTLNVDDTYPGDSTWRVINSLACRMAGRNARNAERNLVNELGG